jgi:tetratricopeptide (TPR) repeat protein
MALYSSEETNVVHESRLTFTAISRIFAETMALSPTSPRGLGGPGGPYGLRDIRSLYPTVSENHLRYLEKWGLLRQSGRPRAEREYSFTDLLAIKHVASELDKGTPLKVILRGLLAEKQGQLELDFHAAPDTPRAKVVALQGRRTVAIGVTSATPLPADASMVRDNAYQSFPFSDPQTALAAKYFIEGSRLDDGEDRNMEGAAAAYRKALVIDPDLVPAIVNLANIHYARDEMIEAQALYERAIGLDPDCFEAYFNLGNIHHDLSRYEDALRCYRGAVRLNAAYPDAHFYLAVTLEKTGHSPEAKPHWKAYQDLAPNGEWADLAREFSE